MGNYLNKGNDLFKKDINDDIYVDKSMLIRETNRIISKRESFWCVTRPRRFGKTMALSMLNAYYSKGCDSKELFHGLKIENDPSFEKHLNRHNVIWIDMAGVMIKFDRQSNFIQLFRQELSQELKEYFLPSGSKSNNLYDVISEIFRKTSEKFIFLIDEWDCIFREMSKDRKLCDDYMDLLRGLFKNSDVAETIDLVYMTGILPIKRYSTQSALNVFQEFNMLDPQGLEEFIGFTQEEVDNLCDKFNMDKKEMRDWYNGYHYSGLSIYNPCSVVKAITSKKYRDYWNVTSSTEAVNDYMNYDNGELKDTIAKLLSGEEIAFDPTLFDNDLTKITSRDAALTVLIHLGYLAFDKDDNTCRIPNYEISQEFVKALKLLDWTEIKNPIVESDRLIKETFLGNTDYINEALDRNHKEIAGPFNKNKEDILGVIVELSYYNMVKDYVISKEETNILGRADIIFHPKKSGKPPMIVELKVDDTPENALKQIEEKGYLRSLEGYKGKVYLLGISYDSRTLRHTSRIKIVEI